MAFIRLLKNFLFASFDRPKKIPSTIKGLQH
jgi:hypothetical protein